MCTVSICWKSQNYYYYNIFLNQTKKQDAYIYTIASFINQLSNFYAKKPLFFFFFNHLPFPAIMHVLSFTPPVCLYPAAAAI